ncbi:MAG TPA: Fic family protein, partial [Deltaproteobacteria bacterium]|nr:Fic family protein [Deltaproteobacteria bacterium]
LERLAANPYITAKKLSTDLNIAFTTAQRTIDKMTALGILREMRQAKRDRVYCAQGILDILERPARLVPLG